MLLSKPLLLSFPTRRSSDLAADDDPCGDRGEVGVVPELLTGMHVAQVHLEDRRRHGRQGVAQGDGRMGQRTCVDDEADRGGPGDRKSTRLNSSHVEISYAVL